MTTIDLNELLVLAAERGDLSQCEDFIRQGVDANAKNPTGIPALFIAAWNEDDSVCRLLLAHGARATDSRNDGWTPLHAAAWKGNETIARLLIEHGADLMARSESGRTPLHVAVHADQRSVTRLLVEHGCDPAAKRGDDGSTPLHIAVMYGRVAIAQYLLGECGVDMDQKTPEGKSVEDLANGRERPVSEKAPMIRLLALHRNVRRIENTIEGALQADTSPVFSARSKGLSPL